MFTGERIVEGGKFNVTYQQSLFAYEWVRQQARGKRVLDVGSGDGYGSAYLAEAAAEVVGLDLHAGAVAEANRKYRRPNLHFVQGTTEEEVAGVQRGSFDIVCCFQTIEHLADQDGLLEQLKQFAKQGGQVFVTTPNKGRFPGFNPYHIRELSVSDMQQLMKAHFDQWKVYGVFGDEKVLAYRMGKQRVSDWILRLDILHAREWLPRLIVVALYALATGIIKSLSYHRESGAADAVGLSSFTLREDNLKDSLDLLAVATVA